VFYILSIVLLTMFTTNEHFWSHFVWNNVLKVYHAPYPLFIKFHDNIASRGTFRGTWSYLQRSDTYTLLDIAVRKSYTEVIYFCNQVIQKENSSEVVNCEFIFFDSI
jgi:hypothetical protein